MKKLLPLFLMPFALTAQDKLVLYYDTDQITPDQASLSEFRAFAADHPGRTVTRVAAFADSSHTDSYNQKLTDRRLDGAFDLLEESKFPLSPNLTRESSGERFSTSVSRRDRRVEINFEMPSPVPIPVADDKMTTIAESRPTSDSTVVIDQLTGFVAEDEYRDDGLSTRAKAELETGAAGSIVRIHNINFYLNSDEVMRTSEPAMEELYQTLKKHPKMKVQIRGHICCNPNINDTRLSDKRARRIHQYLIRRGIAPSRLSYKGFGSSQPIFPIPEDTYNQERINRRVEIMIIENPKS